MMGILFDILSDVASTIVQKLGERAIHETRYLCCFSNFVEDYENEKKELMKKQESLKDEIKEARKRNEEIVRDVKEWQDEAANMNREDTIIKKNCFFGLLPNCIWLYRQGKALDRKTREIKKHIERCKFDKVSRPIEFPGVEYYSSGDFIQFESRNSARKQLHEALKDEGNYMIGLHGIGGSGKTTLAIEVGKEVQKPELFDKVIFVVVSNPPNIRKIRDDIASQLSLTLKGNESERPRQLWLRLRNRQKLLIILDDVWEKLNFQEIGIPSLIDHEGCRVLLTTRDSNVCKSMGCQKTIHLELLSEEDSWILFQKFGDISDESSPNLKEVAQKIASECKGLPVAITTMARTLKEHPLEDWTATLITLQSSKPTENIHEDLKHAYKCLRVSYDNLKDDKAKGLFLLCSMFPEDHEIPNEELMRYAIGTGLFGELESYQIARSHVRFTIDKLIATCLLLKTEDEGCVKMHDLVRDVAHEIANNEIHEAMEPQRSLKALHRDTAVNHNKIRYLYCHNMGDFSYHLDLPNLEILILVVNEENEELSVPDDFFDEMKGIKVLTLEAWYSQVQVMLRSIQVLNNLRTLDLRNCNLGDISVLANLQRIETLELYDCSINELPEGIVELNKLRLFRLQSCEIKENPYKVIGRFSEIEELYVMKNRILNGKVDSGVVADLFDKNKISPALKRYHMQIGEDNDVLYEYLNDSMSRALSIAHFDASISNATIKDLMRRAETLCLNKLVGGCKSISPDFFEAIGGEMNELTKLGLYHCSEIECLFDTSKLSSSLGTPSNFLEKPEHLHIMGCDGLKFEGNLNMRTLRKLCVQSCPKLTYLFTFSIAQSLVLLEDIKIESCDAIKCIIKKETEERVDADDDQKAAIDSMLPKLKAVTIIRCEQLESFLSVDPDKKQLSDSITDSDIKNCPQLQNRGLFVGNLNLRTLRRLYVHKCHKLTYLFTVSVAQSLVLLEDLTIKSCDALECIIKDAKEIIDVHHHQRTPLVSLFPKLQGIGISDCGQLECFISTVSRERQISKDSAASSIDLDIKNCPQLQNRGLFVGNLNLKALQCLIVMSCPKLTYLFTISVAQSLMLLESLFIMSCDALECIIKDAKEIIDVHHHQRSPLVSMFPKLQSIDIGDCDQLECFISIGSSKRQISKDSAASSIDLNRGLFVGNLNLRALRELEVGSCPKLTYLFNISTAQSLVLLEDLTISSSDALECIIKDAKEIIDVHHHQRTPLVSMFPNLWRIEIRRCVQLECFVSTVSRERQILDSAASSIDLALKDSNQEQFQSLLNQSLFFRNTREMKLYGCPQLKSVFGLSHATTMQLEDLYIGGCDGLKHIITVGEENNDQMNNSYMLQKLKRVSVYNCKQLEYVIREYHHDDNLSYQDHTSSLETHIQLPALEFLELENLPNIISICTKKYRATCPSLKTFNYDDIPKFAKASIIDFIEHSDARHLKCNGMESQELLKMYREDLQVGQQKFSQNNSPVRKESTEETVKQSDQSTKDSEPWNSQSTEGSIQDPSLTETSSQDLGHEQSINPPVSTNQHQAPGETEIVKEIPVTDVPHDAVDKIIKFRSITDTMKQDAILEKSKIPTSLSNRVPIQNALSHEMMEHEKIDFHGLFKIDSRRASLLDDAFAKYPHLWEWQRNIPPRLCKSGYKSLSDILAFLKEKTPKSMYESSKKEFENLYAELVFFGFDRDWLASIHQRVIDSQADNEKLKHLIELESRLNNARAKKLKHLTELESQLNNLSIEIARIKDDLSKYETVFDF